MSNIQQQLVDRIVLLEQLVADLRTREIPLTRMKIAAQCNSGQVIPHITNTTIVYDISSYDYPGSTYDPVTGIYTVPVAGTYLMLASAAFNDGIAWASNHYIRLLAYKNGGTQILNTVTPTANAIAPTIIGSTMFKCNAGDTVAIQIYQFSGSDQPLRTNGYNFLQIAIIP